METLSFENQKAFLFTTSEVLSIVQCLAEAKPKSELFENARKSVIVKIRETMEQEMVEAEKKYGDPDFVCYRCKNMVASHDFADHVRICHERMA